jgi:hypothetical protein
MEPDPINPPKVVREPSQAWLYVGKFWSEDGSVPKIVAKPEAWSIDALGYYVGK